MNLPFVKKKFVLFFLISAVLISACTKILTTDIGSSLIPPVDGVNTNEMELDVVSKNAVDTFTRVSRVQDNTLGYTTDPLFGVTTAVLNLQLEPAYFPFYFPVTKDSLFIDSVVLVLGYKGAWGDTSKEISLRVFEISTTDPAGSLNSDSVYPTNTVVPASIELTNGNMPKTVNFSKLDDVDSTGSFKESVTNQIRIRLNDDYGTRLLQDYDTTDAYKSDTLFNLDIKGLQVVPEKTGNALIKIGLTSYYNAADTNTKLAIYYRYISPDSTGGKTVSDLQYFRCNAANSATTNYIKRERTGSASASFIPANANPNDSLLYIDANPGIYSFIKIPGLRLDTMTNKIIHRAELIMEQVPDLLTDNDKYFTAPRLFLTPYTTDSGYNRRFYMPNDIMYSSVGIMTNQSDYGCYPRTKTDYLTGKTIYTYSFDISRYLQSIVTRGVPYYDLILFAPFNDYIYVSPTSLLLGSTGTAAGSPLNPAATGRVRLGGGNNTAHKMKLHIIYSELPK